MPIKIYLTQNATLRKVRNEWFDYQNNQWKRITGKISQWTCLLESRPNQRRRKRKQIKSK